MRATYDFMGFEPRPRRAGQKLPGGPGGIFWTPSTQHKIIADLSGERRRFLNDVVRVRWGGPLLRGPSLSLLSLFSVFFSSFPFLRKGQLLVNARVH